jgi:hypothetical protein
MLDDARTTWGWLFPAPSAKLDPIRTRQFSLSVNRFLLLLIAHLRTQWSLLCCNDARSIRIRQGHSIILPNTWKYSYNHSPVITFR